MQKEDKTLDMSIDAIINRVTDLKNSLMQLVVKIETHGEHADWPQYLDAYSVIAAQMFSLLKLLKNEKTPTLRNYLTLPLQLNAERDEQLALITENRIPALPHDFVPNLLRTKPEPDVEAKMSIFEAKAASISQDSAQKQIATHNKIVKNTLDAINHARDEWETETASRSSQPQTSSINETHSLVAALGCGRGIKILPGRQQAPPPPMPAPTAMSSAKMPSSIKTNIKSASQMHPYHR